SLCYFTHTPRTVFYTLSLHDALPISGCFVLCCKFGGPHLQHRRRRALLVCLAVRSNSSTMPPRRHRLSSRSQRPRAWLRNRETRSEEHTSELQSRENLVCRLLLEKKK